MLYQYLLDEVGRKQVKVVKKRTELQNNDSNGIALQQLERGPGNNGSSSSGHLTMGTGLDAGEPVGRKSTGLPTTHGGQQVTAGEEALISRSRSERRPGGGRLAKQRSMTLRRLFHMEREQDGNVDRMEDAGVDVGVGVGALDLSDNDDDMVDAPPLPAQAAQGLERGKVDRRENRLTM